MYDDRRELKQQSHWEKYTPTLTMTAKLEKYWKHRGAVYCGHKSAREAAGMKNIYHRHTPDDATTIHVVF